MDYTPVLWKSESNQNFPHRALRELCREPGNETLPGWTQEYWAVHREACDAILYLKRRSQEQPKVADSFPGVAGTLPFSLHLAWEGKKIDNCIHVNQEEILEPYCRSPCRGI